MEKMRHEGKSAGMKLQSILEKSPESLGVWMPQIICGFHMTSSELKKQELSILLRFWFR